MSDKSNAVKEMERSIKRMSQNVPNHRFLVITFNQNVPGKIEYIHNMLLMDAVLAVYELNKHLQKVATS